MRARASSSPTNVAEHADEISVTLTDGRRLQAKRVGTDPDTDVAVIKVAADGLTAVPLGDSDKLEVGDFLLAIGNPWCSARGGCCLRTSQIAE